MRKHPITGVQKFHNGVDFAVPENTPVYSPAEGYVSGILTNSAGGNQLIITHPKRNLRTGYAHLNKRLVKKGQEVRKGQKIALTGNTGASTGAHLHFTTKTLNPSEYVNPVKLQYTTQTKNGLRWLFVIGAGIGAVYLYKHYA